MRTPLIVVVSVALVTAACGVLTGPGGTDIRIEGAVRAADDDSPIAGARVEAIRMLWSSDSLIQRVVTDSRGRYSLAFVEEGYCPESLFKIRAGAEGFVSRDRTSWTAFGLGEGVTDHIRCTEGVQIINFSLPRRARSG